jgi:hypothetical protein
MNKNLEDQEPPLLFIVSNNKVIDYIDCDGGLDSFFERNNMLIK